MKKANILALAIIMGMAISACGGTASRLSSVYITPPAQNVIGTYRLTGFGLVTIYARGELYAGDIVYDETDYVPWSGTMTIDEFEMVRRISTTPAWREPTRTLFTQTTYLFKTGGEFVGLEVTYGDWSYSFDGLFIMLKLTYTGYNAWWPRYEYEFWEKVSD